MVSETIVIINKLGLHARASSKLVMLASKFNSDIKITKDSRSASAKSLMTVMMLAANKGSQITIEATGDDEEAALKEIIELFNNRFGEAE